MSLFLKEARIVVGPEYEKAHLPGFSIDKESEIMSKN